MIALGVQTWSADVAASGTEQGVDAASAVLETALVGDAETVAVRVLDHAGGRATDLMLGFADFPATGMLERFARDVLPRLATPAAGAAVPGPGDGQAGSAA